MTTVQKVWEVVFVLTSEESKPYCEGPWIALADTKEQAIAILSAENLSDQLEVLAVKVREFC